MNRILSLIIIVSSIVVLVSCNDNKKLKSEVVEEFHSELTQKDTLDMLASCDFCMEKLKAGEVELVLDSLHEYDAEANKVLPLSEATRARYTKIFTMFPVKDYVREYYSFQTEGLNDVRFRVKFSDDESEEAEAAYTAYMFNPVKIDGVWYVTVKTADQEIDESRK